MLELLEGGSMSARDPLAAFVAESGARVAKSLAEDAAYARAQRDRNRWSRMNREQWLRSYEGDRASRVITRHACEIGSVVPTQETSSWVAEVGGEWLGRAWSVRAMGTFRVVAGRLLTLAAPRVDRTSAPVRVWLEARDGAVRVMVASKGGPARVRFDEIRETATPSTLGVSALGVKAAQGTKGNGR